MATHGFGVNIFTKAVFFRRASDACWWLRVALHQFNSIEQSFNFFVHTSLESTTNSVKKGKQLMIIIIHINQRRNNWKQILLFPVLLVSNTSLIIYSEQERKEVQTKKLEVKERNNPFQTFFLSLRKLIWKREYFSFLLLYDSSKTGERCWITFITTMWYLILFS